ncbi:MAG: 3-deoxy-D-manno-octulosonic acid transferase [Candidatus Puniceispirillaceae bacterium]
MTSLPNEQEPGQEPGQTPDQTPALRRYNTAWRLMRPFLPLMVWRRGRTGKDDPQRRGERFARYQHRPDLPQQPIWLHAVSVGESMAVLAVVRALHDAGIKDAFLITTNTKTAAAQIAAAAQQPDSPPIHHLYQPLDHPAIVDRFLEALDPRAAIFLVSDFWPNLITRSLQRGLPVIFASAQMSERAFAGWQRRGALAADVFSAPHAVLAVDAVQADRFARLGTARDRITIGGSLKLPNTNAPLDTAFIADIHKAAAGRHILLAASTHAGEERIVIDAASQLGDGWFTLLAPRHPERGADIGAMAAAAGMTHLRRSSGAGPDADHSVYIVDTLGEMASLFAATDVVFLGGALVPLGGHNPIEPAAAGLPVISGPHVFRNQAEFDALAERGLLQIVTDAEELARAATAQLGAPGKDRATAKAARKFAAEAGKRPELAARSILEVIAKIAKDR